MLKLTTAVQRTSAVPIMETTLWYQITMQGNSVIRKALPIFFNVPDPLGHSHKSSPPPMARMVTDLERESLFGDYALIGASDENSDRGAAYVFKRSGSSWTQ